MKGKMMPETKWTPGPYECDMMPGPHQPRIEAGGKLIAVVGNAENWLDAKSEWEANAQLLTAALDLYEALMMQEELCQRGLLNVPDSFVEQVKAKRRAALAKARGES